MTPEQFQRLEALFERALLVPLAERRGLVEAMCADDDEVRRELTAMLETAQSPLNESMAVAVRSRLRRAAAAMLGRPAPGTRVDAAGERDLK